MSETWEKAYAKAKNDLTVTIPSYDELFTRVICVHTHFCVDHPKKCPDCKHNYAIKSWFEPREEEG